MINIYLTNLGKYNENEVVGTWVELPCHDWNEVFEEIEIGELKKNRIRKMMGMEVEVYEEYFITDYETDIPGLEIHEYQNLKELNEIAEELEKLDEFDKKALKALLEETNDFKLALEIFQNGSYTFYEDMDLEDVAYEIVNECYEVKGLLASYFNYEAFARDLGFDGYTETKHGVIRID